MTTPALEAIHASRSRLTADDSLRSRARAAAFSIVFPRLPARIWHAGSPPLVADPTVAVVYFESLEFERECLVNDGTASDWLHLPRSLIGGAFRGVMQGGAPYVCVPCPIAALLLERVIWDECESTEAGALAEAVPLLVDALAGRVIARRIAPEHAALVSDAKALVASNLAQPPRLGELAERLGVSTFHLCRIFAASAGMRMGTYREQLRMRRAIDLLADEPIDIDTLVHSLGYRSPRSFRARFKRASGLAVAQARRRRTTGRGAVIRRAVFGLR